MKFQPLNYLMKSGPTRRVPDMSPSELVSNRLEQLRSALESGEVDAISTAVHSVQVLKTSSTLELLLLLVESLPMLAKAFLKSLSWR